MTDRELANAYIDNNIVMTRRAIEIARLGSSNLPHGSGDRAWRLSSQILNRFVDSYADSARLAEARELQRQLSKEER